MRIFRRPVPVLPSKGGGDFPPFDDFGDDGDWGDDGGGVDRKLVAHLRALVLVGWEMSRDGYIAESHDVLMSIKAITERRGL